MPHVNRPSWDQYFMVMARDFISLRATCQRRKVGAVLVRDKRILTTGYNGSPTGMPHCTDVGCLMIDGHCVRCIHAEQNAIIQAALHGISTKGAICYISASPCVHCAKMLMAAGIIRVVYGEEYTDSLGVQMLREAGVDVEWFKG